MHPERPTTPSSSEMWQLFCKLRAPACQVALSSTPMQSAYRLSYFVQIPTQKPSTSRCQAFLKARDDDTDLGYECVMGSILPDRPFGAGAIPLAAMFSFELRFEPRCGCCPVNDDRGAPNQTDFDQAIFIPQHTRIQESVSLRVPSHAFRNHVATAGYRSPCLLRHLILAELVVDTYGCCHKVAGRSLIWLRRALRTGIANELNWGCVRLNGCVTTWPSLVLLPRRSPPPAYASVKKRRFELAIEFSRVIFSN